MFRLKNPLELFITLYILRDYASTSLSQLLYSNMITIMEVGHLSSNLHACKALAMLLPPHHHH